MGALIEAKDISLSRASHAILSQVSLRVEAGDFVTIIGPNGAGKSVLLKCLLGITQPDSGLIERQKDLRLGYLPQALVCERSMPMSAQRFLRLGRRATSAEIAGVVEETGIAPFLDLPLPTLSGGELQRVLLARALLDDPQLLVLDEPAQNLDISGQLAFYKLLDSLYESRGVAILMVSHDLHMVMASTRKVICLYRHVCCSGTPHAVTQDPEFVKLFGAEMSKMMAVYQHGHDHSHDHSHDHDHDHAHGRDQLPASAAASGSSHGEPH